MAGLVPAIYVLARQAISPDPNAGQDGFPFFAQT
jgi:hypothetical protein